MDRTIGHKQTTGIIPKMFTRGGFRELLRKPFHSNMSFEITMIC